MELRDPACTRCKLGELASPANVCIMTATPAELLIVTRVPAWEGLKREIGQYLRDAGWEWSYTFTSVSKCRVEDADATKKEQKVCAEAFLYSEIDQLKPKFILALGGEALQATAGRSGIMKYRGKEFECRGVPVLPTISPSMVKRNPGYRSTLMSDLRYLVSLRSGETPVDARPPRVRVIMSSKGVKALTDALRRADGYAFDLETNGFNEYMSGSAIVSLAVTTWQGDEAHAWAVPLCHPQSPFNEHWRDTFHTVLSAMYDAPRRVAHNGKFDLRWINEFRGDLPFLSLTFDTMLAAHLLDENRPKGLKPLAQILLGAPPWDISTKDLHETPIKKVLKYNALDTWYTYRLYRLFRKQLLEQPTLATLMAKMMVPASNIFTAVEMKGIWTDREQLESRAKISADNLQEIDDELLSYVPDKSEWPDNIKEPNFNPSNFSRWLLFDYLGLPVLEVGKTGNPSMAEAVMQHLQKEHPHRVVDLMLARTKWQKYSSAFFAAYQDLIDEQDRIHTTFKLTGTVTGRLSSGKGEADKVTGRVQNRGVNLQQVPRDGFVRGIFGAPPDHLFVECDYSQAELRIAAYLAQEPTMLALYNSGKDIHMQMAMRMTGKPESQVTKDERKKAKAVNFGFLYGMGARKFVQTAWANYGVEVSLEEAEAFRRAFFTEFPQLLVWHRRQRMMAEKYGRVQSPLGRVRHLPDIESNVPGVKAEAQRQAINSPVQSFASDMTLMALVSLEHRLRKKGFHAHSVGTVHDAINFEVPRDEAPLVVPIIRHTMEHLPLHKFGVHMNLPIVADAKIGTRWGDSIEVPNDVSSDSKRLARWIRGNMS